jgi:hypothetical protein
MGYRGKLHEQAEARRLRVTGMTLNDIATALDVSKSSVSLWAGDVAFTPLPRDGRGGAGRTSCSAGRRPRSSASVPTAWPGSAC